MKHLSLPSVLLLLLAVFTSSCSEKQILERIQKIEEQEIALAAKLEAAISDLKAANNALAEFNRQLDAEKIQRATLERSVLQLSQQIQQTTSATHVQAREEWNGLIDQVLLKLERVKNERQAFITTSLEDITEQFSKEVTRLESIARDQEQQARSLIAQLKSKNVPKSDELDRLVKEFTSDYLSFVKWNRDRAEWWRRFQKQSDLVEGERAKYESAYQAKLESVAALRILKQQ